MNRIIFGMPALAELTDLESHAQLCEKLGFSFIELNMNFPLFQMPKLDIRAYSRVMENHHLFFTLHLEENLDISSFSRLVARAWQDTVIQAIVLAKQLAVPVINMHLPTGVYVTLPDERIYLYARYRDEYLAGMLRFRDLCRQMINDDPIRLCIENDGPFLDFQREAIDLLLENECFALTFDIGHDHINDGVNENFIMTRAGRLSHMHIHDATQAHNHLTLGSGEMDLSKYLNTALKNNCRCVIETKTMRALEESAAYLRQNGYL